MDSTGSEHHFTVLWPTRWGQKEEKKRKKTRDYDLLRMVLSTINNPKDRPPFDFSAPLTWAWADSPHVLALSLSLSLHTKTSSKQRDICSKISASNPQNPKDFSTQISTSSGTGTERYSLSTSNPNKLF